MTGMLPGYFRRRVAVQILALLAVLTALLQMLELLDMTSEVLKREQGLGGLLYYAALRAPAEVVLMLPLAVLLGTMTAMHSMARNLEITTVRCAGISLHRLFAYLLPVALVLAVVQFAIAERVLPQSENALKAWWSSSAPAGEASTRLWAHSDRGPLSIDGISPDGTRLRGLRLYFRNAAGLIEGRLAAGDAHWDGQVWRLDAVSEIRIAEGRLQRLREPARVWETNLRPDDVLRLDVARPRLSSMMLADVIAGARVGAQPLSYYRTVLYRSFTAPLAVFVMLLLALPTAASQPRGRTGSREMLYGLGLGLAFLLVDGMIAALGTSGRLPPLATALAAPIVFAAIGLLRLRNHERI
jgi:lipopolysaccharide export system permease protein